MSKKAKIFLLALAGLIALSAFVGYQFYRMQALHASLTAENAALAAKLDALEKKNGQLQQEIDESQSESFIERMARELLGWVKPGEIKIVDQGE